MSDTKKTTTKKQQKKQKKKDKRPKKDKKNPPYPPKKTMWINIANITYNSNTHKLKLFNKCVLK